MSKLQNAETDHLFEAMLMLNNVEEFYQFFEDVCTIKEIQAISQRFQVARMLDNGNNYHEISDGTGASTATISRVNKCLNYGSGGYRTALERLKNEGKI